MKKFRIRMDQNKRSLDCFLFVANLCKSHIYYVMIISLYSNQNRKFYSFLMKYAELISIYLHKIYMYWHFFKFKASI